MPRGGSACALLTKHSDWLSRALLRRQRPLAAAARLGRPQAAAPRSPGTPGRPSAPQRPGRGLARATWAGKAPRCCGDSLACSLSLPGLLGEEESARFLS
ncbi:hypothetical protein Q9966_013328 [Columba livia]|nr:hypothetical protein Q9966_013328 [Columba livia]